MKPAALPKNEVARLQALYRYDVLDTPEEEAFDRLTRIAALVADVPIALISLIDEDRQWFKARQGLDAAQTPRDVSFCGHAILGVDPMEVPDASLDERFADNPLVTGEPHIRFYLGVPLTAPGGHNIGTLCVIDRRPRELDEAQRRTLHDLAQIAVRELELRKLALTDALTGTFNRRMLDRMLEGEIARARRSGGRFCVALLDMDHFKQINDRHGHDGGDIVLIRVAQKVRDTLRAMDTLFRVGGEEFCVLCPDTGPEEAAGALERIRSAVAAMEIRTGPDLISVTLSGGIAAFRTGDSTGPGLVARADKALYRAKQGGRNQIVLAE